MNWKRRFWQIINIYRLIPGWLILMGQNINKKALIFDEMEYWNKCTKTNCIYKFDMFSILILSLKEYRSLLCFRLRGGGEEKSVFT